ncbi:DUF1810 domain-containing protein [soil metagenome]
MEDLERFVAAQDPLWSQIEAELRASHKTTHWMWFVFPQLRDLGRSQVARHYGLASLEDARAYLAHPVLGARLRAAVGWILAVDDRPAHRIFGSPDDLKLRSCLTLFAAAAPHETLFEQALVRYYDGKPDAATLDLLASA